MNQIETLLNEVKDLCNKILDSDRDTTIKGNIESMAFSVGHHPWILNPHNAEKEITSHLRKVLSDVQNQATCSDEIRLFISKSRK